LITTMKHILLLAVFALFISYSYSQSIWSRLGATDAESYAKVGDIFDRAGALAQGDACINKFFYRPGIQPNHRVRFLAFLCIAFGGNSITNQTSFSGCNYTNVAGTIQYFSENITEALGQVFGPLHGDLNISAGEQTHFKTVFNLVVTSQGVTDLVLSADIAAILTVTDPFVITNTQSNVDCTNPTIHQTIQWNVGNNQASVTVNAKDTVCWNWNDASSHTVEPISPASFALNGYGSGVMGNAVTRLVNCTSTNPTTPCNNLPPYTSTTPFRYCHTFWYDSNGVYVVDCAVHGSASMRATINVGTSGASASPAGTASSSSSSGASSLSSFIF